MPDKIILLYVGYDVALKLEKKWTLLRKNDSKFVSLPGKITNVIQSFTFQLYEVIIDYVFNFIKTETLAQVFSCEFRKIFKNAFFTEHLWTTASIFSYQWSVRFLKSWDQTIIQIIRKDK